MLKVLVHGRRKRFAVPGPEGIVLCVKFYKSMDCQCFSGNKRITMSFFKRPSALNDNNGFAKRQKGLHMKVRKPRIFWFCFGKEKPLPHRIMRFGAGKNVLDPLGGLVMPDYLPNQIRSYDARAKLHTCSFSTCNELLSVCTSPKHRTQIMKLTAQTFCKIGLFFPADGAW